MQDVGHVSVITPKAGVNQNMTTGSSHVLHLVLGHWTTSTAALHCQHTTSLDTKLPALLG